MKYIQYFITILLALVLVQSCTLEKRRYMDGWHVEWRSQNQRAKESVAQVADPVREQDSLNAIHEVTAEPKVKEVNIELSSPQHEVLDNSPKAANKSLDSTDPQPEPKKAGHLKLRENLFQGRIASMESSQSTTGGAVLGVIGFILLVISIGLLLTGMIAELGWTSLGLIIMAMLLAVVAFIFALIALLANRSNGDTSPWFVWVTLIIGGLAVLLWLKVLLDKARA